MFTQLLEDHEIRGSVVERCSLFEWQSLERNPPEAAGLELHVDADTCRFDIKSAASFVSKYCARLFLYVSGECMNEGPPNVFDHLKRQREYCDASQPCDSQRIQIVRSAGPSWLAASYSIARARGEARRILCSSHPSALYSGQEVCLNVREIFADEAVEAEVFSPSTVCRLFGVTSPSIFFPSVAGIEAVLRCEPLIVGPPMKEETLAVQFWGTFQSRIAGDKPATYYTLLRIAHYSSYPSLNKTIMRRLFPGLELRSDLDVERFVSQHSSAAALHCPTHCRLGKTLLLRDRCTVASESECKKNEELSECLLTLVARQRWIVNLMEEEAAQIRPLREEIYHLMTQKWLGLTAELKGPVVEVNEERSVLLPSTGNSLQLPPQFVAELAHLCTTRERKHQHMSLTALGLLKTCGLIAVEWEWAMLLSILVGGNRLCAKVTCPTRRAARLWRLLETVFDLLALRSCLADDQRLHPFGTFLQSPPPLEWFNALPQAEDGTVAAQYPDMVQRSLFVFVTADVDDYPQYHKLFETL